MAEQPEVSVNEASLRLNRLSELLVDRHEGIEERTDPIWKSRLYSEVILHRIVDLAKEAIALFGNDSYIAASILARSLVESVAMMYWLLKKLRQYEEHPENLDLEEDVLRFLFGSRLTETEYQIPNVLSGLDHLEREFNGARGMYDGLSEYTHPNAGGVLVAYAEPNDDESGFTLGLREQSQASIVGLGSLIIALNVCIYVQSQLASKINDLDADA